MKNAFSVIWSLCKAAWRSLLFLATIMGILLLWPDIKGLPEAYGRSWKWLEAIERETIALIALVFAFLWIFWIEVRPLAWRWWQDRRKHRLVIEPMGRVSTKCFICSADDDTPSVTKLIHLIGVRNNWSENKTIKNVQARIYFIRRPVALPTEDGKGASVDIQPGTIAYFEAGETLWNDLKRGPDRFQKETPDKIREMGLIARHPRFAVASTERASAFTLGGGSTWSLGLVISADDMPPLVVTLVVNPDDPDGVLRIEPSVERNHFAGIRNQRLDEVSN